MRCKPIGQCSSVRALLLRMVDAVAVGGEVSRARFSPREPSRCVARVDHRHVVDRVVRSGKHLFAPQNGAGERPQLPGIGRWLPRHVPSCLGRRVWFRRPGLVTDLSAAAPGQAATFPTGTHSRRPARSRLASLGQLPLPCPPSVGTSTLRRLNRWDPEHLPFPQRSISPIKAKHAGEGVGPTKSSTISSDRPNSGAPRPPAGPGRRAGSDAPRADGQVPRLRTYPRWPKEHPYQRGHTDRWGDDARRAGRTDGYPAARPHPRLGRLPCAIA